MSVWIAKTEEPDLGVLEESALAFAQATIQEAIESSHISRAELSRKMECSRSFVSRMMSGSHNLTVKTMARAILACGFEIEFSIKPISWNWMGHAQPSNSGQEPASAGSLHLAA